MLLHLTCRTVGVPGPEQREQSAARTGDDVARRRAARDHQVMQLPGNVPDQYGQGRVSAASASRLTISACDAAFRSQSKRLGRQQACWTLSCRALLVPRSHPPAGGTGCHRAYPDQLVVHYAIAGIFHRDVPDLDGAARRLGAG